MVTGYSKSGMWKHFTKMTKKKVVMSIARAHRAAEGGERACNFLASYPAFNRGGKAWYTLFAHAFNLNVNITSILIVTFANGLGLTDDVD